MGRHEFAARKRRWSLALAAVVIPGAALLTGGASAFYQVEQPPLCCAELVAAPAAVVTADGLKSVGLTPGQPMLASSRAAVRDPKFALPLGVAPERGLQVRTILAARAISALFPAIVDIGGARADSLRWHPSGLALDVMVPNYHSAAGIDLGDRIAAYALSNADRFGIDHVIWRQVMYLPNGTRRAMSNNGSDDANHYTHVHVATTGGGYPTGHEVYFTTSQGPSVSAGPVVNTLVGQH